MHLFTLHFSATCPFASTSGLPCADPTIVRTLGRGDERGVQQRTPAEMFASGRRRVEGASRRCLQGKFTSSHQHLELMVDLD